MVIAGNQLRQTVLDSYCRVLIYTLWRIKSLRNGALSHRLRPLGQTVLIAGPVGMQAGRCTKSNKLQNRIELTLLLFCGEFLVLEDLNRDFVVDESCAFESSASSKLNYC